MLQRVLIFYLFYYCVLVGLSEIGQWTRESNKQRIKGNDTTKDRGGAQNGVEEPEKPLTRGYKTKTATSKSSIIVSYIRKEQRPFMPFRLLKQADECIDETSALNPKGDTSIRLLIASSFTYWSFACS